MRRRDQNSTVALGLTAPLALSEAEASVDLAAFRALRRRSAGVYVSWMKMRLPSLQVGGSSGSSPKAGSGAGERGSSRRGSSCEGATGAEKSRSGEGSFGMAWDAQDNASGLGPRGS